MGGGNRVFLGRRHVVLGVFFINDLDSLTPMSPLFAIFQTNDIIPETRNARHLPVLTGRKPLPK